MLPKVFSEDRQPNEVPLSRKGGAIPVIRPTYRPYRGSARGGSAWNNAMRGNNQGSFHGHQSTPGGFRNDFAQPHYSSYNNTGFSGFQQPHSCHLATPSNPPVMPNSYGASRFKRRRLDEFSVKQELSQPHLPKMQKGVSKRSEIMLDLPLNCRKGILDSHKKRRDWIAVEKRKLEQDRGVKVISYNIFASSVHFFCEIQTSPDAFSDGDVLGTSPFRESSKVVADNVLPTKPSGVEVSEAKLSIEDNISDMRPSPPSVIGELPVIPEPAPTGPSTSVTLDVHSTTNTLPVEATGHACVFRSGTLSIAPVSGITVAHVAAVEVTAPGHPLPSDLSSSIRQQSVSAKSTAGNSSDVPFSRLDRAGSRIPPRATGLDARITSTSRVHFNDAHSAYLKSANNLDTCADDTQTHTSADTDIIQVPNQINDKPRRIFPFLTNGSILTVSMHGSMHRIDVRPLRFRHVVRHPQPSREGVDDACLLNVADRDVAILGHACDDRHISLVSLTGPRIGSAISLNRPCNGLRTGASAVTAMMQPLLFASGGYDKIVHLWQLDEDLTSATPRTLAIKHTSLVQSLLSIYDTSHKLISASADCSLHIWELSSERVVNTLKTSNSIYNVHATLSPFCTLLEVAHRELQFELRDHRMVPGKPVERFGYITPQLHGRYMKGDCLSHYFACGDRYGSVRLWDLRKIREPTTTTICFPNRKVIQVTFDQPGAIHACSSDNQVAHVQL